MSSAVQPIFQGSKQLKTLFSEKKNNNGKKKLIYFEERQHNMIV